MNKLNFKSSWLFFLIPLGIIIFVIFPEVQTKYNAYEKNQLVLQHDILKLDSLNQLNTPTTRDLNQIKTLEITTSVHTLVYKKESFLYYKTGGMLFILVLMGIGMFIFSYLSRLKKTSINNKQIDVLFKNPDNDSIGKNISWEAKESSGSNFKSEVLKKTRSGFKITSSSYTKVFAWSFFLVGLNYLVISFIEHSLLSDVSLTFMKAGKMFFTAGGPFLIVGITLIFMFSPKVFIITSKNKIVIDGEVITFNQVHALQLLEKFVEGNSSSGSYFCYELNIVTTTGNRHNLLSHGDKAYILSDMVKLSQLFNVSVWNKGVV